MENTINTNIQKEINHQLSWVKDNLNDLSQPLPEKELKRLLNVIETAMRTVSNNTKTEIRNAIQLI